jgi:hypothetical protein
MFAARSTSGCGCIRQYIGVYTTLPITGVLLKTLVRSSRLLDFFSIRAWFRSNYIPQEFNSSPLPTPKVLTSEQMEIWTPTVYNNTQVLLAFHR